MDNTTKFMFSISKTFPEFFAYYYLPLINLLPYEGYAQIKNIILSSIPKDIDVKDPFGPDFNVKMYPNPSSIMYLKTRKTLSIYSMGIFFYKNLVKGLR